MKDETFGFDEEFQKAIAAAALKDPAFLKQHSDVILPGYFDYEFIASIVRTARELTERLDEVPTKFTLIEELKEYCVRFNLSSDDRETLLNQLEDIYEVEVYDLEYLRDRVVSFGQHQAFRSALLKVMTLFKSGKGSSEEIYEKSRRMIDDALRVGVDTRDLGLDVYPNLTKMPELAAKSAGGLGKKIPTLIPTLDRNTMGGPGRGETWVVIGLPGRGKSAFLINIGTAALKQGFTVFHYTIGDLDRVDVGVRYAARLTMSTIYEVLTGTAAYMKKAEKLSRYNARLRIVDYPSDTVSADHLRAHASKVKAVEEISPSVIIVDYPKEMKQPYPKDIHLSEGMIYSQLGKFFKEFDALGWVADQPKQWTAQHESDVMTGGDMGGSTKKFQKVDGFLSWNMSYEDEMKRRGRLWVDKTRRAKSYYLVHMETDLDYMLMRECKSLEGA